MDDYAGRVLADRYRLPLPPSDEYDLVETRAFDTYSGQEVLVRQVPLPEVVDAEFVDGDEGGTGTPAPMRAPARTTRRPTDPAVRRAIDAATAAAAVPDHPKLDQVFDVFADGGSLWIVSELVAARPLAALLAEKPLSPYRAAEVASDVLTALRALHAHGWTHRNITARTVLVCDDGRVMLTGLAAGAAEEALCGYDPVPAPPGQDGAPEGGGSAVPAAGPAGQGLAAPGGQTGHDGRGGQGGQAGPAGEAGPGPYGGLGGQAGHGDGTPVPGGPVPGGPPPGPAPAERAGGGPASMAGPEGAGRPAPTTGGDARAARAGAIAAYRAGARAAARVNETGSLPVQRPATGSAPWGAGEAANGAPPEPAPSASAPGTAAAPEPGPAPGRNPSMLPYGPAQVPPRGTGTPGAPATPAPAPGTGAGPRHEPGPRHELPPGAGAGAGAGAGHVDPWHAAAPRPGIGEGLRADGGRSGAG
ncbi:protein kinase, partial [Streptomyces sp. GC420]|uniref:protein kinase n=1 Tax=Streptomyces sp. GC420 TaxID=2697568 RepID=UPI0014152DFF